MTNTDKPAKSCNTCAWVTRFTPREDELARHLTLGCKKPGYEGYTSYTKMACDGVFYWERITEGQHE